MGVFSGRRELRRVSIGGRYSVTDDGQVWSGELPLVAIRGVGVNIGGKRVKVAYLVARAFVPNPECRRWVRHKNGDVSDNRAENLEWSDEREEKRRGRKPGVCWCKAWDREGTVVGVWKTVSEASKATGARAAAIRACLYGRQKQAGGYIWGRI